MYENPITAWLIKADGTESITEVRNDYQSFQALVGGYIEPVTLADGNTLYCNEEGKIKGLPVNHRATLLTRGILADSDIVVGDVFVVGPVDDEGNDTAYSRVEPTEHQLNEAFGV